MKPEKVVRRVRGRWKRINGWWKLDIFRGIKRCYFHFYQHNAVYAVPENIIDWNAMRVQEDRDGAVISNANYILVTRRVLI